MTFPKLTGLMFGMATFSCKDTLFEQIAGGDLLPQLVANHLFSRLSFTAS